MHKPPKPAGREGKVSFCRYLQMFRKDVLSAQSVKLYRAKMAEFRTPFFRSFVINEPDLINLVLIARPDDFPKSNRVGQGLKPLLGQSVFVTNGNLWKRQRRIIDPSFEGGRLRDTFPAMLAAAKMAASRMPTGIVEIEEQTSHAAADVIFRTLFSIPIENDDARDVFQAFRSHQRTQPLLNLGALLALPQWLPRFHRRTTLDTAKRIRSLITRMTVARSEQIRSGTAPNDLATKIMTTTDPVTGERLGTEEMVDQVAIFFLAGHETSASALAWALWLLAANPDSQERVAAEAGNFPDNPSFADLSLLPFTRDVFRETLRLYPPVPMMVREATKEEIFRDRRVPIGAQIVISPWHLHRHERIWTDPDSFRPQRWQTETGRQQAQSGWMPFSTGPRVCPGAGFAMAEGVLLLAAVVRKFRFAIVENRIPMPVAHLTVRGKDGIWLEVCVRDKNH